MPDRDRDRSVEHVLRQVLSAPGVPQSTCPDAEAIAAWHEGLLRAEEAAVVEGHIADCSRCQALVAVLVQTSPAAQPATSLWGRWHLGWVVPLATAATAAALWIAVPGSNSPPPQSKREASSLVVRAIPPAAPAAEPAAPAATPAAPSAAPAAPAAAPAAQAAAAASSPQPAPALEKAAPERSEERKDARGSADAALIPRESDKRQNVTNSAPQPFAAPREQSPAIEIVTPGGSIRWRIVEGQQVEWSRSPATGWGPAVLDSSETLTAGASPAPSVCWIVGRQGAIYLTTDGMRFTRVPFPEMADLVAVNAIDDRTATVSSADGRTWRTTDRGSSWSLGR